VFTRSSKHRAGSSKPIGTPAPWLKCIGLGLCSWPTADHVLYRPSNYNPPALLVSMLITIERRASCSMFARSCKHPINGAARTALTVDVTQLSTTVYRWTNPLDALRQMAVSTLSVQLSTVKMCIPSVSYSTAERCRWRRLSLCASVNRSSAFSSVPTYF